MKRLGEDIKDHVAEVLDTWETLIRQQPWFSLPEAHRRDNLADVLTALIDATLLSPDAPPARLRLIEEAALHGTNRRAQLIPEHLILTEYHLLRQALWYYLMLRFGASDRSTGAIMAVDAGISIATNASMWGYHREEIEALGKWQDGIERMVRENRFAREDSGSRPGDA